MSTAGDKDAAHVIRLARERAQAVLDISQRADDAHAPVTADDLMRRAHDDALLASEYAAADLALRDERARRRLAVRQLLALERRATDIMLTLERTHVDDTMVDRSLLDVLVHDLRSMLSAVALNAAAIVLAADKGEPVSLLVQLATNIQRATAQTDVLLGDMHELATMQEGKAKISRASADVVEVVRTAVEINASAAAANQIAFVTSLPASAIELSIDAPRFMRVVVNLLTNALKFTPSGGTIRVEVARKDREVEITVADSGPGIAPELHEAIFQRFRQGPNAGARGLGLGLYIARAIVEAHGGRIWVESTPGSGSTFTIRMLA